jgi:hypothetical protein
MTEYQWRILKRAVRERFDKPEHVLTLTEGRNAIRDIVDQEVKKPSRKRRSRSARFLQQPGMATTESAASPSEATKDPPVSNPPPSASPQPSPPSSANNPGEDRPAPSPPAVPGPTDDLNVDDWGVASADP